MTDIIDSFEKPYAENAREFTNERGCQGDGNTTLERPNMDNFKLEYEFVDWSDKEVTHDNVRALAEMIKERDADVVVAIGGGKAYDLVRLSTLYVDFCFRPRVVLIPTQLASNASGTSSVVVYTTKVPSWWTSGS